MSSLRPLPFVQIYVYNLYIPAPFAIRLMLTLMNRSMKVLTLFSVLLLSLSAFTIKGYDAVADVVNQVRDIVNHPELRVVRDKEEIPASVFTLLNKRLAKEYKEEVTFTLLNGNELVPGAKRVGTNRMAYRKLNFAYNVGQQWIISYYHNNGRVGFQQILIVDEAKRKKNITSVLIDNRPRSPQALLAWLEAQEELEITYPTASEPDFFIF